MSEHSSNQGERASELADEVSAYVREGKHGRATQAFQRGWRDAVPELPLRFSVVLVRPDRELVAQIHRRLVDKIEPKLCLQRTDEFSVQVVLADDGQRLGSLPAQDARLLADLQAPDALYHPQVLEIRYDDQGRFHRIAVELVRPELRYCSACGNKHSGPHINCADCRSKRRRKGAERYESSPVNFHEALDTLAREPEDSSDKLDF